VRILPIAATALGGDALGVSLASATAAANAVPAQAPLPSPAPPPEQPRSLPRTGGDSALPLGLALLAVGAAGAALVRRSRIA
jgi:LPXTG-motif cell wall-anchored protein